MDLGDVKFLLGLGGKRNVDAGTIRLTQDAYVKAVLDKLGMADVHPAKTPAEAGPICIEEEEIMSLEDIKFSRSATGSLPYLSRCTRSDITHSVMVSTRSMSKPGPRAMSKLTRVLTYLKGTVSTTITYGEDDEDGDNLTSFVDSDHAGDQDKGCSTTGVVVNYADEPENWKSTKQPVAISTGEAEYVAMSKSCVMILFFRNSSESVYEKQKTATVLSEDNSGAVSLSRSAKITPRTKHIDETFHHVKSLVAKGVVDVTYIKTELQRADILTESLGAVKVLKNRLLLPGV